MDSEFKWRFSIEILIISGGSLAILLLIFLVERILLSQKVREIPLRICVTGTRGKSSVTRLIAGMLTEHGLSVLAKTTGSKPVLIFPDGTEKEVPRQGKPTILEGKEILRKAVKLKAQAVVAEMMSIGSETIAVEAAHLYRPHILVITNTRLDHLDQMGNSREGIAGCFASAITEKSVVFVPDEGFFRIFREKAERLNSTLHSVPGDAFLSELKGQAAPSPFIRDVQLSLAVAEFLGIDSGKALAGMKTAREDFGSLRAWKFQTAHPSKSCLFISAFAANDPESTASVLDYLRKRKVLEGKRLVALVNFRSDRGDRTLQWLKALQEGFLSSFDRAVLCGGHSRLVERRMKKNDGFTEFVMGSGRFPSEILEEVGCPGEEYIVIGMGNMEGIGKEFVVHMENTGESYDL